MKQYTSSRIIKSQKNYYTSSQRMHTILLKTQYYSTPAPTCFWPSWSNIRDQTTVRNICLILSAYSCRKLLTMWYLYSTWSCALKAVVCAACILVSTVLRQNKFNALRISRYFSTVEAAQITVFSKQLYILHTCYVVMRFRQLFYMQKTLSNCIVQLYAPWWWASEGRNM